MLKIIDKTESDSEKWRSSSVKQRLKTSVCPAQAETNGRPVFGCWSRQALGPGGETQDAGRQQEVGAHVAGRCVSLRGFSVNLPGNVASFNGSTETPGSSPACYTEPPLPEPRSDRDAV